jgi:hypothetical protein
MYVPALHEEQSLTPAPEYLPGVHAVQLLEPVLAENLPAEQALHTDAPELENLPAEHL